jgi:hypothetical protein
VILDPFGNPEDDSEWSEAFDAVVPRVDLVGRAANGSNGFLLMKSGEDGLMTPEAIRDLIAKSTQTESIMAAKTYRYVRGGRTFTSATPLTNRQLDTALVKAKAKTASQVAVFDALGNLVGTVDASAITAIAAPPQTDDQKAAATATANAAKVSAQMTPAAPAAAAADQGAQEVAKSLAGATFREDGSSATRFTKAAGGTVDDRFDALLKSVDAAHSVGLRNAVAVAALRFVAGGNASSPQAVRMSKLLACDLAAGEQARQRSRR